jgi:hypothetical protein
MQTGENLIAALFLMPNIKHPTEMLAAVIQDPENRLFTLALLCPADG